MTSFLQTKLRQRFYALAAPLGLVVACGGSNSDGLFNPGSVTPSSGGTGLTGGAGFGFGGSTFGGGGPAGGSDPSGGASAGTAGRASGGSSGGGGASLSGGSGAVGGSQSSGGTSTGGGGASSGGTSTGGSPTGGTGIGGDAGGGDPIGGEPGGGSDAGGQGGGGGCEPGATEICDGIDNDCNGRIDNGVGLCPTGCEGVVLNGKGYMFCLTLVARTQARASTACVDNQMHLAWVDTAEENAAIVAAASGLATNVNSVWIGASDEGVEGEWRWVEDGATAGTQFWSGQAPQAGGAAIGDAYANWGPMRPDHGSGNEDCVALTLTRQNFTPGEWDDEPCTSSFRFVCESF